MKRSGPLKRRAPLRRTRFKRKPRSTRYSRRERDFERLRFVKTLPCYIISEWPNPHYPATECEGEIEADHQGARGLGQKCPDSEVAPLCSRHHRERTDHTGSFKFATKEQVRAWRARAMAYAKQLWEESR